MITTKVKHSSIESVKDFINEVLTDFIIYRKYERVVFRPARFTPDVNKAFTVAEHDPHKRKLTLRSSCPSPSGSVPYSHDDARNSSWWETCNAWVAKLHHVPENKIPDCHAEIMRWMRVTSFDLHHIFQIAYVLPLDPMSARVVEIGIPLYNAEKQTDEGMLKLDETQGYRASIQSSFWDVDSLSMTPAIYDTSSVVMNDCIERFAKGWASHLLNGQSLEEYAFRYEYEPFSSYTPKHYIAVGAVTLEMQQSERETFVDIKVDTGQLRV